MSERYSKVHVVGRSSIGYVICENHNRLPADDVIERLNRLATAERGLETLGQERAVLWDACQSVKEEVYEIIHEWNYNQQLDEGIWEEGEINARKIYDCVTKALEMAAVQAAPGAVGPEPVSGERAEGAKAILADAVSLYNRVTRGGNEGTDRLELTMGDGGKVIVMAPASRAKARKEA